LIESIAPYPEGNDDLYALHTLSNGDKHRLCTVVSDFVELHRVVDPKGRRKPVELNGLRFGTGPGLLNKLHLGGVGITLSRDGTIDPAQFEKTFHLAFADETPYAREPVIPTLKSQAEQVRGILEKFEECSQRSSFLMAITTIRSSPGSRNYPDHPRRDQRRRA
jgi:hypothetical protein